MRASTKLAVLIVLSAIGSACGPAPASPRVSPPTGVESAGPTAAVPKSGWRAMPFAPISARTDYGAAWTGRALFVWGGLEPTGRGNDVASATGALFHPLDETWSVVARSPLSARLGPTVIPFAGGVAVWGGADTDGVAKADGAIYHVDSDTWTPLPAAPYETPRPGILVGDDSDLYLLLETDRTELFHLAAGASAWVQEPDPPAVPEADLSRVTWVGDGIVWLVYPSTGDNALALRYDKASREWSTDASPTPFAASLGAPMVWAGSSGVVLGSGRPQPPKSAAAALALDTDRWRPLDAGECRTENAVWTGHSLVQSNPPRQFDELTGCQAIPEPPGGTREGTRNVWSGTELLVWSGKPGQLGSPPTSDGLIYRP